MCLSELRHLTTVLTVVLILQPQVPRATGIFELQIKSVQNLNGELQTGLCCDGERLSHDSRCTLDECDTYFRVCLKEYQVRVLPGGPCILGTGSSTVIGGNSFSIKDKRNYNGNSSKVAIPFHFAWPRSYSLILEAWDYDNDTAHVAGSQQLIERVTHSGMLNPGDQWQHRRHHGRTAQIDYIIRVRCDENYYGVSCNKLCRPRHDFFGHYTCDPFANKVCVEGWIGPECTQAVCKQGCHGRRGYCEVPGQCKCQYGWQGLLCDKCILFPGCVHGTCSEPWKCDCETNWGGLLCDKDLNYCGTHQPCRNGGTCVNPEPNEFQCICAEGFGGQNCDAGTIDCPTPCQNGGICQRLADTYQCSCPGGYTGNYCETKEEGCTSYPCLNGARCVHAIDGFFCQCPPGFSGDRCEVVAGQCGDGQCQHGATCYSTERGYFCSCPDGYEGKNCSHVPDRCRGATCQGRNFHLILVLLVVVVILIVSVCIYLFVKRRRRKERAHLPPSEYVNNQRVTLNLIQNLPKPCSIDGDPEYGYKTLSAAKGLTCKAQHLGAEKNLGLILPDVGEDVKALKGNRAISKLLTREKMDKTNREREKLNGLDAAEYREIGA
ncbi:protein jagged-1b [Heptranchias perlo]|uniref:protein jagged-1b n=1 Tax=Heptranchias perlo TaxID=212740 RepID=UPI00355A4216